MVLYKVTKVRLRHLRPRVIRHLISPSHDRGLRHTVGPSSTLFKSRTQIGSESIRVEPEILLAVSRADLQRIERATSAGETQAMGQQRVVRTRPGSFVSG
jgi:hypothetical protein